MDINQEINNELTRANRNYPLFQSRHEAYAVLKEEYEELINEIKDIEVGINIDYWNIVKKTKNSSDKHLVDEGYNSIIGDEKTIELLKNLSISVECSIKELIQIGAMIEKAKILECVKMEDSK